jgi:hypothetical protein
MLAWHDIVNTTSAAVNGEPSWNKSCRRNTFRDTFGSTAANNARREILIRTLLYSLDCEAETGAAMATPALIGLRL